jgi:hypothetical protein
VVWLWSLLLFGRITIDRSLERNSRKVSERSFRIRVASWAASEISLGAYPLLSNLEEGDKAIHTTTRHYVRTLQDRRVRCSQSVIARHNISLTVPFDHWETCADPISVDASVCMLRRTPTGSWFSFGRQYWLQSALPSCREFLSLVGDAFPFAAETISSTGCFISISAQ